MTYLNQAGTSWPKPAPVQAAVAEALRGSPEAWAAAYEAHHARVARALGASDPGRLLLTPGATSALAVGLADHPWAAGDRVLVSGFEHHALHRPASLLAARGVELTVVRPGGGEAVDLDGLERELGRGRVRLVAMTAACNVTGELLPVEAIVSLAHDHGALCLVDGAQVCGWLPVHVERLGVDVFAFAGHKGLHGPWGVGGLWVAPHVAMSSSAAQCELPAPGAGPACATMPGSCDVGSVDRVALAGLSAALDWLDEPDRADRLATARGLVERLATSLEDRPGVRLHGARDPARRLPTLALTIEGRPTSEVTSRLERAGITVGGGLQCAPLAHETLGTAPGGVVRVSVGPSNDDADIERLLAAL